MAIRKRFLLSYTILLLFFPARAVTDTLNISNDSLRHKNLLTSLLTYFNDANKNKKQKKFDFSIIGGPHYSTDTKFGIGLVAAGLYHSSVNDTLSKPSNVSLFGDVSTIGFYLIGIRGNHLYQQERYRVDYNVYFYSFPSKYWGIGYESGNNDANKSDLHRWQAQIKATFLARIFNHFYVGPMASFDFVKATKIKREELLEGQPKTIRNLGLGFSFVYDSRDVMTNPHRGCYIDLTQCFRPKFLGNEYAFSSTNFSISGYNRIWKGGILAADLRSTLNFGNPSWAMMAKLGSPGSMRGYYEGRYRDKQKIETQIELRQHVWKRNGLTLWVGAGSVFPKINKIRFKKILPNYGIGYRWEFKKDVNIRLDYGFGKAGQSGFTFNINEAF